MDGGRAEPAPLLVIFSRTIKAETETEAETWKSFTFQEM